VIHIVELSAITVFLFMILMFIIAQVKKNNSIVDTGWGIGFILRKG
jgi:steroid 5-alpha reductase family enzyme